MKRRLLAILAATALLLLLLLIPATTGADEPTPFSATGTVCVAGLPKVKAAPSPVGIKLGAFEEQINGAITSSPGWAALEGATLEAKVHHEESTFNFTTLTFSGNLSGDLHITTGSGKLRGELHGSVAGAFLDPANPVTSIYQSAVQLDWTAHGGKAKAKGQGTAAFAFDPSTFTFCGPLNLSGEVRGA